MITQAKTLIFLSILLTFGCNNISSVSRADSIKPIPESETNTLFVFVGEKIKVEEITPDLEGGEIPFDSAFKAEYKIIQSIYGKYDKDIIEFKAYDHYGYPPFAEHKNVLLFVSKHNDKYYHEKYQYFDVYKTKDGRWASCGDPYKFDDIHRKNIKAINIEFKEPLFFDLTKFNDRYVKEVFIEPYFKLDNKKAECLMGTYVNDLFEVKKEGVLKARGLFK